MRKSKFVTGAFAALSLMFASSAIAETYLSIGSNPVGNTAYQWAAGISELVNKNVSGVKAAAEGTKGYVANVQLMLDGKVEAGFSNTRLAYEAHHAQGSYEGQKKGQIVGWMSVKPIYMQVVVKADSDIKSLSDLRGKRVGMGQPGGTSMLDADLLMETVGLTPGQDFTEFRVKLPTMVDMLGDNQLDALIWSGTPPMPPVIKLKSQHDVRFLDIPRDISEKIMKVSPAYTKGDLKANVYADQPNEVKSYMLGNVLLIKADVPEEIVYQATKAVMENLDFMASVHPAWKTVEKDAIVNGFTIPVHPGALRYYREAGVAGIEEFAKRVAN
ncbi:MAG: TAXI family TRAP transporter solute-binding subunit [Alphaproteobacteria bacterium]|jgi:TRAP transporter TAXI family solute receptor